MLTEVLKPPKPRLEIQPRGQQAGILPAGGCVTARPQDETEVG